MLKIHQTTRLGGQRFQEGETFLSLASSGCLRHVTYLDLVYA